MEKNRKITIGITIFLSAFMLFTAFYSLSMKEAFRALGFPDYFRIELNVLKMIGAVLLLFPQTPARVRQWVYAGFGIVLISASTAHFCSGDPFYRGLFPLIDLGIYSTCVYLLYRLNKGQQNNYA
ncbi:DoxX family protein [Chitinophaga japonensis]|uniref:DoxX-like protein n=1 Tax=Chitinophaga japonensis TaxID=104662 RepID=A0A562SZQ5_CHIJA|nr:DoxX family protein [Chitinophaga japonensis]TWI86769.1 DoxX-like protein [Chitinophaga japonensis]